MNYTKIEKSIIWLDSFSSFEYKHKSELLKLAQTPFELIENLEKFKAFIVENSSESVFNTMRASLVDGDYIESVLASLNKKGICVVTQESALYPEELKTSPAPPILLYCKGNLDLLQTKKFSIVGSRKTPTFAGRLCEEYAEKLSKHFTIVTGLAEGGDTHTINGALQSGNLISVLAYGYDFIYPECNRHLLEKIIQKGLVITEHCPDVSPKRHLFIVRNRIIASLGQGCLIVSAGERSGAKITAEYALEYGKAVFAFPYNVGTYSGAGCNEIIKNGGFLCDNIVDIGSHFGINFNEQEVLSLGKDEELVYHIIRDGEVHIQEIENKSGLKQHILLSLLSLLEIKGLVSRTGGNKYCALK